MSGLLVAKGTICYKALKDADGGKHDGRGERDGSRMTLADEQLVLRAQDGQVWAFEELVMRHQNKAFQIAYHMCQGDHEEARDVTQEAFLRTFRNLRRFRGESSFYTWFYRILVNTCLDGKRRLKRAERFLSLWPSSRGNDKNTDSTYSAMPDRGGHANPLEQLTGKRLSQEIRKAVADLPERQRMAFQLKVLHGMSIKEIAEVMDAAEGTVKSHLFRATRCLQETLKDWT